MPCESPVFRVRTRWPLQGLETAEETSSPRDLHEQWLWYDASRYTWPQIKTLINDGEPDHYVFGGGTWGRWWWDSELGAPPYVALMPLYAANGRTFGSLRVGLAKLYYYLEEYIADAYPSDVVGTEPCCSVIDGAGNLQPGFSETLHATNQFPGVIVPNGSGLAGKIAGTRTRATGWLTFSVPGEYASAAALAAAGALANATGKLSIGAGHSHVAWIAGYQRCDGLWGGGPPIWPHLIRVETHEKCSFRMSSLSVWDWAYDWVQLRSPTYDVPRLRATGIEQRPSGSAPGTILCLNQAWDPDQEMAIASEDSQEHGTIDVTVIDL